MFCNNCGEKTEEGKRFCTKCGAPVPVNTSDLYRYNNTNSYAPLPNDSNRNKSMKGIILIILLLLLIVLLVGIIVYVSMESKKDKEDSHITGGQSVVTSSETDNENSDRGEEAGAQSASSADTEYIYRRTSKVESDKNLKYEYEFNEQGYETECRVYSYDTSELIYRRVREYNEEGKEIRTTRYDASGNVDWMQEITYGHTEVHKSVKSEEERYYSREGKSHMVAYDGAGNILVESEFDIYGNEMKRTSYGEDGTIEWSYDYKFEYDDLGNIVVDKRYDSNGNIYFWQEREFDSEGIELKRTNYTPEGTVDWWYEYKYDQNKGCTEMVQYNAEGSVMETYAPWNGLADTDYPDKYVSYEYDEHGNCTNRMVLDANGTVICWTKYEALQVTGRD